MPWFNRNRTPTIDPASRAHWRVAIPDIAAKLELSRMRWFKQAIAFLDTLDEPPSFSRRDLGDAAEMALKAWQMVAAIGQIDRQLTVPQGRNDFIDLLYNEVCEGQVPEVWAYQQRYEELTRDQQILAIAGDVAGHITGAIPAGPPFDPIVAMALSTRLLDVAILASIAVAEDLGDQHEAERLVSTLRAQT